MRNTLVATLRAVLCLALPAAVGLVVLRTPLVQLVFQRGAYTETSTHLVAAALALYALGLPAHCIVEIAVRAFYAMHDTKSPVAAGVAAMGLNVALSLAFLAVFDAAGWLPHSGLALSNSLATTAEMAALIALLRRRLEGLEGRRVAGSLARMAISATVMAGTSGVTFRLLTGANIWLAAGGAILIVVASYVGISVALGSSEPSAMWDILRSRRRTASRDPLDGP